VFSIRGQQISAVIKYRWQIIYIRHILAHAEYDQEKWKP
jgi:mRNA-degrading endonuclease HigB of HigAB toxin-antitoxin module